MKQALSLIALTSVLFTHAVRAELPIQHRPEHDAASQKWIASHLAGLLETYKQLHAHPELSLHEQETAALVAYELRAAGYEVTEHVGGFGVVGILKNGPGPTLMIRGDMDALPITEDTGLPYASKVQTKSDEGEMVGVMHACGHDVHTTNLLGTAKLLIAERASWSGTLMIVAQPAEEVGRGALMMMEDGLFKRFPRPDYALALHVEPTVIAGKVALVSGWAAANVDSVDITLYGRGGHGAQPHHTSDPIVAGSYLVTELQTIVSRRINPQSPAVVTVGSFHGGTKHSIIPDEVHLQLTVRSYTDEVRHELLESITQLTQDICKAHRCTKPPTIQIKKDYTPAVYNDPQLTSAAEGIITAVLGEDNAIEVRPTMGGEDFGRYARTLKIPGLLLRLGATAPKLFKASKRKGDHPLPGLHSSQFAPDAALTLGTGIRVMGNLALAILGKTM